MAVDPRRYGGPDDLYGNRPAKLANTWLVKDVTGECSEFIADQVEATTDHMLLFKLRGELVGCVQQWLWYRIKP